MADSTAKPPKPYPEFPLYPHNSKRWAKKIKGRTHYFGAWNNWQAALERYQYEVDYIQAGRTPPPRDQMALTVGQLVNGMLEQREPLIKAGELSIRTWLNYKKTGAWLIDQLGRHTSVESLQPSDFAKLRAELSSRYGLVGVKGEIVRACVFFNYAYKNGLIDKPVRYGDGFRQPAARAIKQAKLALPKKVFSIDELRTLFAKATPHMRAFMLLALNGGLGNNDVGLMERKHIKDGWVDFPRPKTAADRKFPLWKETQKAIDAVANDEGLLFTTRFGSSWSVEGISAIRFEFWRLCKDCELAQPGRGFYSLRHCFRTVADGCRDQVAINHIMGHSSQHISATYIEWIEPERLQAVVDHVYAWVKPMFRKPAKKAGAK